jgi:hypothetical protein
VTESQRRNLQEHIATTRIGTAASICRNENRELTLLAMRFINLCTQILCPTVYCDLGIARMSDTGLQDTATGTPAYGRSELLSAYGIDDFAFEGSTTKAQSGYLRIDRDIQYADSFLNICDANANASHAGRRILDDRISFIFT